MYLDKDAFKINDVSLGQYLVSVEYGHNKVWGPDTGRNLAFKTVGTYGGIVWKFKLTFAPLNKTEIELISPILDSENQQVTFYDVNSKNNRTITTYTGDWATLNRNTFTNVAKVNESFDIGVIATAPIKY